MNSIVETEPDELRENGFVRSSRELTRYFYMNPEETKPFAKFAFGLGRQLGKSLRYTASDLFGEPTLVYYYVVERKELLVKHLETLFLGKNGSGGKEVTQAFTLLMHNYNFHWSRCLDRPRPASSKGTHSGVPNSKKRRNLTLADLEKFRERLPELK